MTTAADGARSAGKAADGMIWEIDDGEPAIEGLDAAGRPDPAYAAALGLVRAPFGRRALAATCDAAIWLALQLPLWFGAVPLLLKLATGSISPYGFVYHPDFVLGVVMASITVVLSLVYCVVQLILHGVKGWTIGKALTGIRTVNVRTLARPRVGPVLLRFLIVWLSNLVPLLGPAFFLLSPTFDPEGRGRGWHDKAANVWLVDVRKGLQPYDEKRMRVARKALKVEPAPERPPLPSLATPVHPGAQPEYRPGSRVSAGVLGVARPHEPRDRATSSLPPAVPQPASAASPPPPASPRSDAPPASPRSDERAPQAVAPPPATPATDEPTPLVPSRTSAHAVQPPVARPRFGLRLDTGESILVTEPVLLGRNPDATKHPGARAIALADNSRSLSKTHLLVRPVEAGLEVVDCHSTNGSALIRAGVEYAVAAGTPVATTDGDTIRIGDRLAAVVRV